MEQSETTETPQCDYCDEHGTSGARILTDAGQWMDLRHAPKLGALADRRQGGRAR